MRCFCCQAHLALRYLNRPCRVRTPGLCGRSTTLKLVTVRSVLAVSKRQQSLNLWHIPLAGKSKPFSSRRSMCGLPATKFARSPAPTMTAPLSGNSRPDATAGLPDDSSRLRLQVQKTVLLTRVSNTFAEYVWVARYRSRTRRCIRTPLRHEGRQPFRKRVLSNKPRDVVCVTFCPISGDQTGVRQGSVFGTGACFPSSAQESNLPLSPVRSLLSPAPG